MTQHRADGRKSILVDGFLVAQLCGHFQDLSQMGDRMVKRKVVKVCFLLVLQKRFCLVAHSWGRNVLFGGSQL